MLYGMAESGATGAPVYDGCCDNTVTVGCVMTVVYDTSQTCSSLVAIDIATPFVATPICHILCSHIVPCSMILLSRTP